MVEKKKKDVKVEYKKEEVSKTPTISQEEAGLSHERDVEKNYKMVRVKKDMQGAWIWKKEKIE